MLDCLTGLKIEAKKGFKMRLMFEWFEVNGGVRLLEAIVGGILCVPECWEGWGGIREY
jgi:hypothetical protein